MYVALSASRAMEQYSQYSMSMKNKHFLNNMHFRGQMINRFNGSLEEHAFTYDSRFVWPPRSYSCSFCKRVFRSAQALGGHMNIHRRDRARLKQSLSPQNEVIHPETYNPSQVCYKSSNLNPTGNPNFLAISPHSPPTVLPDWKTAVRKGARREDFWFLGHDGCVESNLSMGLNLFISPSQPYGFDVDDHEVITGHKRHKSGAVSSGNIRRCFFQSEVLGLRTGSLEELDLELRLGDPPKAK